MLLVHSGVIFLATAHALQLHHAVSPPRVAPIQLQQPPLTLPSNSDLLEGMPPAELDRFFGTLREHCDARELDASELARFEIFCDVVRDNVDSPRWRPVLQTGQSVQTRRHYPRLSALPCWDRLGGDDDIFPWLAKLEAQAPAIAAELRAVCDAPLPDGWRRTAGEATHSMADVPNLSEAEREIYVPGFDDRPASGYYHAVLVANDERQDAAALFPVTMAALEACGVRSGVRLIAFGKQLPHTALHWHSDGRNYALAAHLPLAGPTAVDGPRVEPHGGRPAKRYPTPDEREGAAGMVMAPLVATAEGISTDDAVARAWTPPAAGAAARAVVFDTSFLHSAYNDGGTPADILYVDFFHPELSEAETAAITVFQSMLREAATSFTT